MFLLRERCCPCLLTVLPHQYTRIIIGAICIGIGFVLSSLVYEEDRLPFFVRTLSSAIMIGDREHDVLGAKENGLDSIGVLFGYGNYHELKNAGATFIADAPMDILKYV